MSKKKERKVKTDAEKKALFKKLANVRGKRAIRAIQGLGKLAHRGKYGFDADDVRTMETAFKRVLGDVFASFDAALKAPANAKAESGLPDIL